MRLRVFERCTESARRVIFFARHEACVASAPEISTVDLLRGIARESKPESQSSEWVRANWNRICDALWPQKSVEQKEQLPFRDIGLSGDAKLALLSAAEVSQDNPNSIIDPPTLFLGLLSFENDATHLLEGLGLDLRAAWSEVRRQHKDHPPKLLRKSGFGCDAWRRLRMTLFRMLIFFTVVGAGVALLDSLTR